MKKILVISFNNTDVTTGIEALLTKYPDATVLIPVTENETFVSSVVNAVKAAKGKFQIYFSESSDFVDRLILDAEDICLCQNPIREILREATPDDILAMSWDESVECHMALHSVEDFALETWDISDGLNPIEVQSALSDDLYENMQEAMSHFIDAFAEYVTASVLDLLDKTMQAMIRSRIQEVDPEDFKE